MNAMIRWIIFVLVWFSLLLVKYYVRQRYQVGIEGPNHAGQIIYWITLHISGGILFFTGFYAARALEKENDDR